MLRKIWSWVIAIIKFLYVLVFIGAVCFIGYIILLTIGDKEAVSNSVHVNTIALILSVFSLPGIIHTLISIMDMNLKNKFKVTTKCPNCKQRLPL